MDPVSVWRQKSDFLDTIPNIKHKMTVIRNAKASPKKIPELSKGAHSNSQQASITTQTSREQFFRVHLNEIFERLFEGYLNPDI